MIGTWAFRVGRAAALCGSFATVGVVAGCAAQSQGPVVATPAPDGTGCYEPARVPFYGVANAALDADRKQRQADNANTGLLALGAVATVAGLAAGGRAGNIVAGVGALAAVAGALALSVRMDQRFIADVGNTFAGLSQCRQDEALRVRAEVRAKRITVDQGRDRLVRLRNLMLEDADVARRVNAVLAQRNRVYDVNASDVDTRLASEPDPQVRRQKAQEVAQARQTIQSNQRALTDQAVAINKAADTITVSSIERTTLEG